MLAAIAYNYVNYVINGKNGFIKIACFFSLFLLVFGLFFNAETLDCGFAKRKLISASVFARQELIQISSHL